MPNHDGEPTTGRRTRPSGPPGDDETRPSGGRPMRHRDEERGERDATGRHGRMEPEAARGLPEER